MLNKVLIATGGTGGHIYPALSVARKIMELYPSCRVVFAGGLYGSEKDIIPEAGFEFKAFPAKGVLGKGIKSLGSVWWVTRSLAKSYILLRSLRPDVVVGFGGYAGFIPVLTARMMKIPTAIHEQNSLPGMTNRVLGRKVKKVMLSYEDIKNFFPPEKVICTGNPVRTELLEHQYASPGMHRPGKRLLVLGGSQGASAINSAILERLDELKAMEVKIWHQTGERDFEKVNEVYQDKYPEARVDAYIQDMAGAYDFADLILSRAGASTISEICVAGKACIFIPFPHATHDHQMVNARYLEEAGAAMVLDQGYLAQVNLARVITDLLAMPEKIRDMGRAAAKISRPDAADRIVQELVNLKTGN
ncbi:undecaprenyldiphospho-muramoylpentapeptide beta-N-acetylglucosaminyltransferase [Desulfonatronospira sp.]|uniref:undecaprenyldiphospho-muramoylpentapeptide beta-N-acetylglucosaminyltransferase n=1 Tax=Desulfonatronospira sp. TaxID=1962951 RepID=UPI0025C40871|nr:undecaprenyldiphospho-muramoylpentapeptide beta-N-acetylglucosaminyltransferase [Desulfonatronospira sp.]